MSLAMVTPNLSVASRPALNFLGNVEWLSSAEGMHPRLTKRTLRYDLFRKNCLAPNGCDAEV